MTPRLITHRPDQLRLEHWSWATTPDGSRRLAAWLDVAHATGDDWHDPALVLIDVECLPLMTTLYGPRAGDTLVLAASSDEAYTALALAAHTSSHMAVRTDRPQGITGLVSMLTDAAGGDDPELQASVERHPAGRARLRLVGGGQRARAGGGA